MKLEQKTLLKMFFGLVGLILFFPTWIHTDDISFNVIKDPKPTCEEKVYVELEKVGEITPGINDENFLVKPMDVEVDGSGNIFVYDNKMAAIFKYDRNLKLVKTFGKAGRGPSDMGSQYGGGWCIFLFIGNDNILYVGDKNNRTIHFFDLDGKFIKDIRLRTFDGVMVTALKDSRNNFYTYHGAASDKCIAIYNEKGELTGSLLDITELGNKLYISPVKNEFESYHLLPYLITLEFGLVENDRLAAFSHNSGFFYLFQDNRLRVKKALWPKQALEIHKAKIAASIKREEEDNNFSNPSGSKMALIKSKGANVRYFSDFFVDNDNKKYFYLTLGRTQDKTKFLVYMFDLKGALIKVLYIDSRSAYIQYPCKRNNLFYTIGKDKNDEDTIIIYREVTKK